MHDENRRLLLDAAEAARRLGTTRAALYARIGRGTIPARRLGGRLVFVSDELEAWARALPRVERAL